MKKVFICVWIVVLCITCTLKNVHAEDLNLAPNSASCLLMEATSRQILYSKKEKEKMFPASTTKIMTMILLFESIHDGRLKWDEELTCSAYAASMGGSQVYLEEGEQMSVHDLFKAISIASANDACVMVGERIAGTNDNFVKMMNEKAKKLKLVNTHFMNATGGGVTASGGEAILQAEFVRDWFRACKKEGIHTCLDTNGFVRHYDQIIDELIDVTDLVLLDLKQLNDNIHKNLIGVSNKRTLEFAQYLQKRGTKTWIRYVVVPGYTDFDDDIHKLGQFVAPMENVEKIELLPYHRLGAHKWETMGEEYQLKDVQPPSKESLEHIKEILQSYGLEVKY